MHEYAQKNMGLQFLCMLLFWGSSKHLTPQISECNVSNHRKYSEL